jgi:hypothetical protein
LYLSACYYIIEVSGDPELAERTYSLEVGNRLMTNALEEGKEEEGEDKE